MEGDGALMSNCYEEIAKLRVLLNLANYPNIRAIAESLAPGNLFGQQQLTADALSCVKPGLDFFAAADQLGKRFHCFSTIE